jgi:aryl-alcohol dehydrogenase-like predicted oxidoreductase
MPSETLEISNSTEISRSTMERADIAGTALAVSRVALGTWAIGGWMWGGTDDAQSVSTVRAALEHGINLIDTAPVYGFGHQGRA